MGALHLAPRPSAPRPGGPLAVQVNRQEENSLSPTYLLPEEVLPVAAPLLIRFLVSFGFGSPECLGGGRPGTGRKEERRLPEITWKVFFNFTEIGNVL